MGVPLCLQDGCPQGAQLLAYGDCRLYAQRTCSQPLQLNATQGLLAGSSSGLAGQQPAWRPAGSRGAGAEMWCWAGPATVTQVAQLLASFPLPRLPAAGFPVLLPEVLVTGFSLVAGQGIAGGDHGCPGSLLPGKCAVRSTEEALLLCLATPACRAVTVLLNGGCEPVRCATAGSGAALSA